MTPVDWLLITAIAAALAWAVIVCVRNRRKGKCCGDCAGCSCGCKK